MSRRNKPPRVHCTRLDVASEAAHQLLMSAAQKTPSSYKSERLIAFSDGVMAVAITLLVLDLKLPEGLSDTDLYVAIPALSRALWCYVLSFIVIGLLWMAHHNQFAYIRRVDGVLLWLNLFFLMAVALIPFTTSVMSDHHSALPTMMYATVLMAVALLLAAIWGYACRSPELISDDVTPVMRRQGVIDPLLVSAVFALSIGVAHVYGAGAGQWTWLLAALAGPVASRLSRV
jgi:uncharacterized membrane protein